MTTAHRILIIGDSYMKAELFETALRQRGLDSDSHTVNIVDEPRWTVDGLREFEGDPAEIDGFLDGHDIVAFHGAPISAQLLEANPQIRLLACARGGPVNVDIEAAFARGIKITTTPGKNAEAVADLTLGFLIQLLRNVPAASADVGEKATSGRTLAESAFEGAKWFGRELSGFKLGLVGYGNVAKLVAKRALALGMQVYTFDPYATPDVGGLVSVVGTLEELLEKVDAVSLHARATAENRHLFGASQFAAMSEGSVFINTARESLVDENALLAALNSGHLAGVAMDVNEPDGPWRDLVAHPNLILTPHIAGATQETLVRGASMLADEIAAYINGKPMRWSM
jgi:D-3-phosphoglycerate dehydrogenase